MVRERVVRSSRPGMAKLPPALARARVKVKLRLPVKRRVVRRARARAKVRRAARLLLPASLREARARAARSNKPKTARSLPQERVRSKRRKRKMMASPTGSRTTSPASTDSAPPTPAVSSLARSPLGWPASRPVASAAARFAGLSCRSRSSPRLDIDIFNTSRHNNCMSGQLINIAHSFSR
ncbi:hypothetical protein GE09DRAFT_1293143 [Coniochaeta sp. 2T2.1]|nr:hypothetical protein GE09DRAFT_1293143 [Coniochaeta sp. 2T2.1]